MRNSWGHCTAFWTVLWAKPPSYRRAYSIALETLALRDAEIEMLRAEIAQLRKERPDSP
jgi:hypothetical protein